MAFDDPTRSELQKVVGKARDLLVEEFTAQCQRIYGIQPSGFTMDPAKLDHLPQEEQVRASLLRDRIDHLAAGITSAEARSESVARVVREQGFTVLNRLCALRMCEERGLVQECVRSGYESKGFRLYDQTAAKLGGDTFGRYALYLQLLFDELSFDLGVLFDRFSLTGLLFPGETALKQVLVLINASKLSHIWAEDEAIGWVYQYFNSPDERKAMREASAAPRNSREMAVRNQFFTPRYVVEFLTDNTLGRIWYEMRRGDTALKEDCRYLVGQSTEIFLAAGETVPSPENSEANPSQEELLRKPVYIAHRPKRDPRDLRVLDPACGSGHFLLYAFDLLERIYEEAWMDPRSPEPEGTGRALRDEFATLDDLRRITPKLIIEHNLHGIDIDPRAVQIAALALWLRAQRSWKNRGLKVAERPRIDRSNIVTAEPMPGEAEMRRDFTAGLKPRVLGQLMDVVFEEMRLAGEAGSLLKIEEEIKNAIAEAKRQWIEAPEPEQQLLFPGIRTPRPHQQGFRFDLSDVTDDHFWHQAEERTLTALKEYAVIAENGLSITRRLFAEDASQGFAFIDLCSRRYDVVLMNPPFGDASIPSKPYVESTYGDTKGDVYKAFVECFQARLNPVGLLGIISSRSGFFLGQSEDWRTRVVLRLFHPLVMADLGGGVLDAMVEVAAYVLCNLSVKETADLTQSLVPILEKLVLDRQQHFSLPKWQAARNGLKRHQAIAELEQLELAGFIRRRPGKIVRYTPVRRGLQAVIPSPSTANLRPFVCIRLLDERDKGAALLETIAMPGNPRKYVCLPRSFSAVPGSRFAYWVGDSLRLLFEKLIPLESQGRAVQSGASTMDDFRFLRLNWEVSERLQARSRQATETGKRWVPLVKGGAFSRYYMDWELVIDWGADGRSLKAHVSDYRGQKGWGYHWAAAINGHSEYFRPGLTWPRRTQGGLNVRVMPAGSIFGDKGPAIFVPGDDTNELWPLLSLTNSIPFRVLVSLQMAFGSFEVGVLERTPIPALGREDSQRLSQLAFQVLRLKQEIDATVHTSHAFGLPALLRGDGATLAERAAEHRRHNRESHAAILGIQTEVDDIAFNLYGIDQGERATLAAHVDVESAGDAAAEGDEEEEESVVVADVTVLTADLIAYFVGASFGRWDIRIALEPSLTVKMPIPFEPLPICPPGVLVSPDGLPAAPGHVVSKEWLRARPDANTLPPDGTVDNLTCLDSEYPLQIIWDGILVDDPGFVGGRLHQHDVVRLVGEGLCLLWKDRAQEIEIEACRILGVADLRDYFRRPSGFFADHLKRHSKSRRKAPIFLPLSTESGGYTVWLYYPRLSDQTLYTCVTDYVDPKLRDTEMDINRLRGTPSTDLKAQNKLDDLVDFQNELRTFREQLLRIAALPYKPDQNDGVLISAAPLWELFRNRPWQAALRKCWTELNEGKHEWSGLARAIWPDRVRKACSGDRSLAIAHGLENLYEG